MNVYDTLRIGEILQTLKYEKTDDLLEADIIILNTCHIREKATEKVFSEIGRLRSIKERRAVIGKSLIIGISGCVAQAEGSEILKRAKEVNLVFGPQTWHKLPEMIKQLEEEHKTVCNTDFPVEEKFEQLPEILDQNRVQAGSSFLVIQEGCDKFCTYCVVPYTRGSEYSRPVWQIMQEAKQLVKIGAKEITLLGQNVSSYHGETLDNKEWSLGRLLLELATIEGLERIRYTTSYPTEIYDDLIMAHKEIDKLMPFLHLPIQSGSNSILKAMNRPHSIDDYLRVIDKLRNVKPNMAFSSDFIVGFPGETEQDFKNTLQIIDKVKFIQAFAFIFSPRPGTPAALKTDSTPKSMKEERLKQLQDVLGYYQHEFNKQSVGKTYQVLVDRAGRKQGQLVGKSPYMQAVHVDNANPEWLGEIINLKILASHPYSLNGVFHGVG